jgi:probable F420-dependent oxidoreductase
MTDQRFRFGVVAAYAGSGAAWIEKARRIEEMGYETLVMPDTLQHTLAPFPALAAAASVTRTLRIGTYVLANDLRHPVAVAKEAATLDLLSGGRFQLGLGAGRPSAAAENRALGMTFDAGGVRVARLAESLAILKPLLAGEAVDFNGVYYSAKEAKISPLPLQPRLPMLVAGSGRQLLSLAAREADTVALGMPPQATESALGEKIAWLRAAAGDRFPHLELNINIMAVAGQVSRYLAASLGSSATAFAASDAVAVLRGTTEQMCQRLQDLRSAFGITSIVVSDELMQTLAPVVSRLAAGR